MSRFQLMLDGAPIHTKEALVEKFISAPYDMLDRFKSGALSRWLEEHELFDKRDQIKQLDPESDSETLVREIGRIFGSDVAEKATASFVGLDQKLLKVIDADEMKAMFDGQKGEPKLARLEQLANQGDTSACSIMAVLYFEGIGLEKDFELSFAWAEKAAKNNPDMEYHIGICYVLGLGVKQDKIQGERTIREAGKKGCEAAKEYLEQLKDPNSKMRKQFERAVSRGQILDICKKMPPTGLEGKETWGGHYWWKELAEAKKWRLQQNYISRVCRILSPDDKRQASGLLKDFKDALDDEPHS